jgi:iron complex outermembrane receptor protein
LANNDVKAEKLHDFEAGFERQFGIVSFTANLYYMYYVNQLVLNGELNNVGAFIRTNSGKATEAELNWSFGKTFKTMGDFRKCKFQ